MQPSVSSPPAWHVKTGPAWPKESAGTARRNAVNTTQAPSTRSPRQGSPAHLPRWPPVMTVTGVKLDELPRQLTHAVPTSGEDGQVSKTDEWAPVTPAPFEAGRPVAGRRPVPAPSGSGRASAAGRSGEGRPPRSAAAPAARRSHLNRRRATAGLVLLGLVDLMWHASLTSLSLLILLLLAAVALAAGVSWAWGRWPARWALCGRALSLLLVAAMGSVISLDALNRSEHFYASLGDLLGLSPSTTSAPSTQVAASRSTMTVLTPGWQSLGARQAAAGRGTLIDVDIRGAASGIDRRALVDLPPEFFLAPALRLPAVEMLPGWPGGPVNITGKLDAQRLLDQERQTYRMPPVVAVLPTTSAGASSECVDAVSGQRNGTYLADDVPQAVTAAFRVLPGASWATIGYSTGGFCAANLALHHADRYVAGASLSGYFSAAQDPNTGRLYGHSTSLLHRNSPTWLIGHTHLSGPPLFVMASRGDPDAVREQHALLTAARSGNPTFPLTGLPQVMGTRGPRSGR